MKDRLTELAEKYGSYTRIPLKSTEVSPGVPKLLVEAHVRPVRKFFDKPLTYYRGNTKILKEKYF